MDQHRRYMTRAIELSRLSLDRAEGGPFGAVVVRDGLILGEGWNRVLVSADPTAHAEVVAIRAACRAIGSHVLAGAALYSSCEPCPMCLAASHWARIDQVWFANDRADAAAIGFDDQDLYQLVALAPERRNPPAQRLMAAEARVVFEQWAASPARQLY